MRSARLILLAPLAVVAGCGGAVVPERPAQGPDPNASVICSGKPRYCAVIDAKALRRGERQPASP